MRCAMLRNYVVHYICMAAVYAVVSAYPLLASAEIRLDTIRLPDGFKIEVYTDKTPGARSMTLGDDGTLYVSTRNEGNVYAIRDNDGDNVADEVIRIAERLHYPNGVAWRDGSLYVAEINRILMYDDIASRLNDPPKPVIVRSDFPTDVAHGWKFIRFGPDSLLYVPVGAPVSYTHLTLPTN